jgi:signal transduction histidine kinase
MGEVSPSLSPDASPPAIPCQALVLGADPESAAAIGGALCGLGASVTLAHGPDEALALLARGDFAFLLLGDAFFADVDDIVRRARLEPRLARLPIVVLAPPGESRSLVMPSIDRDGARGRTGLLGVVFATRSPAEVLESQLALLVELHRTRTMARDAEDQLGQARLELRDAVDTNVALAEQARHAISELGTAQTQLVQAAKLAALGELVAGVAHEINNPLSFSISHLGTLRRGLSRELERLGELEPETRAESGRTEERLDGVALGLDRIKSLVVKLQTFSRLDDGKSQALNVPDAINTVLTILHHRLHDGMQVSVEFGAPETIYCQSSLINQCVMNLLVNAIDAIEPREAEGNIHVSARAEGEFYVLRVVDNGYGIAPGIQGRIFEPFFTTKPEGKGTGLGLSIAASVVKKHDGTLELVPADAGGTQAVIRLPLGSVVANLRPAAKAH